MLRDTRHSITPATTAHLATDRPATPRCPACQLQLCKSRSEAPHGALKETSRDEVNELIRFTCATCSAVMVRSANLGRPGWSHQR